MKLITNIIITIFIIASSVGYSQQQAKPQNNEKATTYCNPLDLNYRYYTRKNKKGANTYREAADPVVVIYQGEYYLFSSKTLGYWHSTDLAYWYFIPCTSSQLPGIDKWAPTIMVYKGKMYFKQSCHQKGMYVTTNPKDPNAWSLVPGSDKDHLNHDASLFFDSEDGKIWYSYGCSPNKPIYVQQVDGATMLKKGPVYEVCYQNAHDHGWEARGGRYLEGSQILKHKGIWYVIFAGYTLDATYADGVYTANTPTGSYTYAEYSPVSNKETGFAIGAGHGHFFQDLYNNWWKATCSSIGVLDHFERRINLFPAGIDSEGQMYANTTLTDYPITIPTGPRNHRDSNLKGWMLLSRGRKASASSAELKHSTALAFDENIKTWWSAASGNKGEWLKVDLGIPCTINAIQVNFAEHKAGKYDPSKAKIQYRIEFSTNNSQWNIMVDKWEGTEDRPHDYTELLQPVKARYIRLTNRTMPYNGHFAVRDLRIFGNAGGNAPSAVGDFSVKRLADTRKADLSWKAVSDAEGYVIRYGIAADKLDQNYQLYKTSARIVTLNKGIPYYFRIDSFNRNGYTKGSSVKSFATP